MKVSKIGLIQTKLSNLDEQFPVQDMLIKTGQISQFSSGIYAYGHLPYLVKKTIDDIITDVLTKHGCSRLALPLLQPESIWEESGRLDKYISEGVMFRCPTDKGNYCLCPTAEEAVVTYAKSRLMSYKQLPVTYFQIGEKFRNELRSRGFLLRGKSFDMMDAYSFGRTQEDLDVEYENIKQAYLEIFEILGLDVQPVGADNGSIGGSRSEEFMCISEIGEDKILFDEVSHKAFNSELLEREDYEEHLKENYGIENTDNLHSKRAVELGHIFQLGDKYASSMNATFVDSDGSNKNYVMGCYGIGVSRTLAMIYEQNIVRGKDGKFEGISLPINLAPYLLYIIPKMDDEEKYQSAVEFYEKAVKMGIPVLFDDRDDLSIGAKIKDSKMLGVPYISVFGRTLENGLVEVENTKTSEKLEIKLDEFMTVLETLCREKENNKTIEEIVK